MCNDGSVLQSPALGLVPGRDLGTGIVTRDAIVTPALTVITRTITSPGTAGLVHKIVAFVFPAVVLTFSLSPLIDT